MRIWAPISRHAAISHALHRRPRLGLEPGMFRLGPASFGVLARSRQPLHDTLRQDGLEHRIEPIQLKRGRRAWSKLTAGLLVSRNAYGEHVNRFYAHGLPAAERRRWDVMKLSSYAAYDRRTSPRAWSAGNLVLVPPDVWRYSRVDRREIVKLARRATSPEGVARIQRLVADTAAKVGQATTIIASSKPTLTRQQVLGFYQRMAAVKAAASTADSGSPDLTPPLLGGGHISSGHSGGAPPPSPPTDEELLALGPSGKPRWMERELEQQQAQKVEADDRRTRSRKLLDEQLERLRQKIMGRRNE